MAALPMAADYSTTLNVLCPETVPLGEGPPTKEELLVYYPAKFTWKQLKTFVNSGDLGLLRRDKKLQPRYERWVKDIKEQHGSMGNRVFAESLCFLWLPSKLPSQLPTPVGKG
jgi:hypothetical protein